MFQIIYDACQRATNILIHRHVNPDPDALGAQGALALMLREAFPDKSIKCVGKVPDSLAFLCDMDEVSYDDYLCETALVIVVDTGNEARIDGNLEWMHHTKTWIKIDHHPDVDPYAMVSYVDTSASSTSEIIFDFYTALQPKLQLCEASARLLYAGIVGDTGRFLHPNTTPHTLQVASQLRQYPFDVVALTRHFIEVTPQMMALTGYVQTHFDFDEHVASIIITNDLLNQYHVSHDETTSLVGVLGQLKGVESWVLFLEKKDAPGTYRCRIRSKDIPIHHIAQKHDGGGHPLASGANAMQLKEVQQIIDELKENIRNKGNIH